MGRTTTHFWNVGSIGDDTPVERERFIAAAQAWMDENEQAEGKNLCIVVQSADRDHCEGLYRVRGGVEHGPAIYAADGELEDDDDARAHELTEEVWALYCDNDLPGAMGDLPEEVAK
jgi:hypothetical protein